MTRNLPAPNPDPTSLRRSALGLLIVALLVAQLVLLGADQCPVRPGGSVGFSRRDRAPDDLPLLTGSGDSQPAERTAQ